MATVSGVSGVAVALNRETARIGRGVERGMKKAGLTLQRASQLLVPVDTGNLKNSAFTRATGSGASTEVVVGYTANYALFVHENLEAHHTVGQAKFLEQPYREMREELTRIVMEEARKG